MLSYKSKLKKALIFAAIIVATIVVVLLVKNAPDVGTPDETSTVPFEDITYNTDSTAETLEFTPYFTMATEPVTYPSTDTNSNVSIYQVPKDPNEVIDRTPDISPDHPEFMEADLYNPFFSAEGKVYRNDKVITLSLLDGTIGYTYSISFGAALGTCNRFLYLNPAVTFDGEKTDDFYFFFATPIGGGYIESFYNAAEPQSPTTYTFERALEQRNEAKYKDAQNPGVVWYTTGSIDRPVYIDALLYSKSGELIASVRITIEKSAEDGTYAITDIDNNNLLVQNDLYPEYTADEMDYILSVASETLFDADKVRTSYSSSEGTEFKSEDCIIDLRPEENGLFFDEFVPLRGCMKEQSYYTDSGMDILAVTYRPGAMSFTMYFYVVREPSELEHGLYQYIGRDYCYIKTVEELKSEGWRQAE